MVAKFFFILVGISSQVLVMANLNIVFAVIWPYTWYMKVKIWGTSGIVWVNIRHLCEAVLKHFRDNIRFVLLVSVVSVFIFKQKALLSVH